MAPLRGALAHRPGQAHGLPRDHPRGDRPGRRGVAGPRPPPGRRPGGAADPRPALRLRGVARSCGARSCPGSRPAGCRAWPPAWWSSASGPACASTPPPGGASTARSPTPTAPRPLRRRPRLARGHHGRHRQGLQRRRRPDQQGHGAGAGRRGGDVGRHRAGRPVLHRQRGHRAALPALAGGAVHDLDAAAGGRAQAALQRPAGHAGGPAPLRAGLHHLHADGLDHPVRAGAHRGPHPGPRDVRRRLRARHAAPLRAQGQERPGGPRGHPPGRGDLPHPRAGGTGAVGGRAPPVRADLEAHGGLPDERRHRHQRPDPPGRDVPAAGPTARPTRWPWARRRSSRPAAGSSPSPGSCGPTSRARTIPTPSWPTARSCCPRWPWATWSRARAFEPGIAHHPAAGPLHRGLAGQGDGGVGRGPALDLRQRHRHHFGPGLRLEEGHGPGAQLHRLRRRRPAGALLRRPGRLRLHGQHGGRPRRDRLGPRGVAAVALALLLRHVVARRARTADAPNGDGKAAGAPTVPRRAATARGWA